MFSKPLRPQSVVLSVLSLMAFALGGCTAASAETEVAKVSMSSQELTEGGGTESVAACGSTCYGPCKTCILGVCEDTCM